jgi:hypothetical protein
MDEKPLTKSELVIAPKEELTDIPSRREFEELKAGVDRYRPVS